MPIFRREMAAEIKAAARDFPAIVVSGPRRAGKTFLLRQIFRKASYHLLEDPDLLGRVRSDPQGWLDDIQTPAIIDEIQNAPDLFSYIRSRIDLASGRRKSGQWILTGSQQFSLMEGVTESMTGRAATFELMPLSLGEIGSWSLVRGSFPEVVLRPRTAKTWFRSYIQTYLERDVRSLTAVKDLTTFRRFLALVASRTGQVLNKSDLAAPLGISVPTITQWLGILETTGHIIIVPPYFENFSKRLIKSPKLYWVDSGLACFLLGLESQAALERSPFLGAIFEGFLAAEIVKNQVNRGRRKELYFFRDQQGLEVDFVIPSSDGKIALVEAKWSKTLTPSDATPLTQLLRAMPKSPATAMVVHRASSSLSSSSGRVLVPGVRAVAVEDFLAELAP